MTANASRTSSSPSTRTVRRRQLAGLALGTALLGAFLPGAAMAQDKRLTLMTYGALWERIFRPLADDLKKDTGITLEYVSQTSAVEGLTKLQANRDKPQADVWFTSESVALRAATDTKLFVPLDPVKIPNLKMLMKGAANDWFVASYYAPLGIVYRPDLVPGGKITSWNDLWQPAFKNKVSLPAPNIFPGRMILISTLLNGGDINNIQPGLEFLAKQKPNLAAIHSADAQARRALAQGEIWAMVTSPSAVGALRDQKIPAAMVSPKPAPLFFEGVMITRSGKEDLAAAFVNKLLSPEWQKFITDSYNMGPVRTDVKPSAAFLEAMPKEGDGVVVDEAYINANIGKWTDRFNEVTGK